MPSTTLATLRQKAAKKLYAPRYPVVSATTTAGTTTALNDTLLAAAGQAESFYRAWLARTATIGLTQVNSGTTLTAAINATVTTNVEYTGSDVFTVGEYILIDSEAVQITAIVTATNMLTIVRGQLGTAAAAHVISSVIYWAQPLVSRVSNVDFSGSTSQLTFAPANAIATASGDAYEVHYKFHPLAVRDKINEILENLRRPILLPLTLVTDGDMEAVGVTNWTAAGTGGTPTLSKLATFVLHGRQTLLIVNGAGTTRGFARSASINLRPSSEVFVSADVYVPASGSAKVTLRDITNGADIDTAATAATGWVHLAFTATLPPTCEVVQVWLETPLSANTTYWGSVQLLPTLRSTYTYPSTLEWSEDMDKVFYFPRGSAFTATTDDNAYDVLEGPAQHWSSFEMSRDDTAVVPFRLELARTNIDQALYVKGYIDYDVLYLDTQTTTAPDDIVIDLVYAALLDDWAQEDREAGRQDDAKAKAAAASDVRIKLTPRLLHFMKPRGRVNGAFG